MTVLTACALIAVLAAGAFAAAPGLVIPADVEVIHDVEFGKGSDTTLKLHIVRPRPLPTDSMPVVIFVHGGGFYTGNKGVGVRRLIPLAQRGYFGITIDYRLSGVAPFPAQIEDCKCAARWLRAHAKEYNVDPQRIGAWGGSAGGTLVALLGLTEGKQEFEGTGGWEKEPSSVQAVCDWFGRMDIYKTALQEKARGVTPENWEMNGVAQRLSALIGGVIWENPHTCKWASPITYARKGGPPFLIMHGDKDETVPLDQSQDFHKALKKVGVDSTLMVVKGAGHGWSNRPDLDEAVADFFDKHFRKRSTQK